MDDCGSQEAQGVGEGGELEPRIGLLGDRGPADQVAPLQDQRLEARLGEVGPVDQPVVTAADNDGVALVAVGHRIAVFLGVLKEGKLGRFWETPSYRWSMFTRAGLGSR